jgi:putative addiction module component (TIGR02574 family)
MILEKFPEIAALTGEEREMLAFELLESIGDEQITEEIDPAVVVLLERRRSEFLKHPDEVRSWEEVKAGIRDRYRARTP